MTTDNTAHPAPTPAPVAVPEGVRHILAERAGRLWTAHEFLSILPSLLAAGLSTESLILLSEQIARETAPRPEPVMDGPSFGDYWTPDPEPVVAPLPSEDDLEALTAIIRKTQMVTYPDGKGGHLFRASRPAEVAEAVFAALAPYRAAERQEAAREAVATVLDLLPGELSAGGFLTLRAWLADGVPGRADGVTGRSGT